MQRLLFLIFMFGFQFVAFAQIPLLKKTATPNNLQKIVSGLSNNFSGIQGELIGSSAQSQEYQSLICWNGAEKCFVTQYAPSPEAKKGSVGSSSWQAFFLSLESFKTASKQYKEIYQQINNSKINYNGKSILLKSKYEAPTENIGFHTILFENEDTKRLQIELQISNMGMEWQVKIAVFEIEKKEQE